MMADDCCIWEKAKNGKGYGVRWSDGRLKLAHRVAYEQAHGPIPEGLVIDHLCRVRACVNPEHMEVVTLGENTRRALSLRSLEGDAAIRWLVGEGNSGRSVARVFGISHTHVQRVLTAGLA